MRYEPRLLIAVSRILHPLKLSQSPHPVASKERDTAKDNNRKGTPWDR